MEPLRLAARGWEETVSGFNWTLTMHYSASSGAALHRAPFAEILLDFPPSARPAPVRARNFEFQLNRVKYSPDRSVIAPPGDIFLSVPPRLPADHLIPANALDSRGGRNLSRARD